MTKHANLDQLIFMDETDELTLQNVLTLFPEYDPDDIKYDKLVSNLFVETYAYRRSTGLTVARTAHYMGYSSLLLVTLLAGKGLGLERWVSLARAEVFAMGIFQGTNLDTLKESGEHGDWKAAVQALEKVAPETFGAKLTIDQNVTGVSNKDCETHAKAARALLLDMRKGRK